MAFPTAVNDQITDIVSQSDVDALKEDPTMAEEGLADQVGDSDCTEDGGADESEQG